MITLTVSPSSSNKDCFPSLTQALESLPSDDSEPVSIFIEPGIYYEKVCVLRSHITIMGEHAESTIITYDDYANAPMPDGSKRGTFRSYTMFLDGRDITLSRLTIRNSSSPRSKAGQAIALYADGDRIVVSDCRLESYQDTLFTGPLPPAPFQPGGFTGPKEFAPRIPGRQFYKNCYICGDIDFIFGSATAYFENCEIASVFSESLSCDENQPPPVYGYITAASTPENQPYGYVFFGCRLTGTCPLESVYLGRPWRSFAKTVFLCCSLGEHIKPEGFHDWNKTDARETVFYGEYQNTGAGAGGRRASFVKELTEAEASFFSKEAVLSGTDGWNPL